MPDIEVDAPDADPRIRVSKGQLQRLVAKIKGTELQEVTLRTVKVNGKRGIHASYTEGDQYGEIKHQILVIGDGVVEL